LQVLHLVAGVAAWAALVWWAAVARREAAAPATVMAGTSPNAYRHS